MSIKKAKECLLCLGICFIIVLGEKMKELLLVIDAQQDFINESTQEALENLKKLLESQKYEHVIFTKFVNSEKGLLYERLGYHGCITSPSIDFVVDTKDFPVIEKSIYSAVNQELLQYIKKHQIDHIVIAGFDTDACVFKTCLDLFELGYHVSIIQDCCGAHDGKSVHEYTIQRFKRLIGKDNVICLFT